MLTRARRYSFVFVFEAIAWPLANKSIIQPYLLYLSYLHTHYNNNTRERWKRSVWVNLSVLQIMYLWRGALSESRLQWPQSLRLWFPAGFRLVCDAPQASRDGFLGIHRLISNYTKSGGSFGCGCAAAGGQGMKIQGRVNELLRV